jgi:hypothetical protein
MGWKKAIEGGKAANDVIATIETKNTLTEDQKTEIAKLGREARPGAANEAPHLVQGRPSGTPTAPSTSTPATRRPCWGARPTRPAAQLLHALHTGLRPEVDAATQRRFDDGHRYEALARPVAEEIIGDDLYPVVGSEGRLSASFDGLTMDETPRSSTRA